MSKAQNFTKKPLKNLFLYTCLMLGSLFISACGSEAQETPTLAPTKIVFTPTATVTPSLSPWPLPSATPLPTATPTKAFTPAPTSLPNDWASRWLRGTPCKPPCYENIIPGKTTRDEAEKIFKANPFMSEVVIKSPSASETFGLVSWKWKNEYTGGFATYQNDPPYLIDSIITGLRLINLAEVIKLYGEPSHVFAKVYFPYHSPAPTYSLYLVYLSSGFMVSNQEFANLPEIASDMSFNNLTFFVPGLDGLDIYDNDSVKFKELLVPWEGFKSFDYYCRDIKQEKLCQDLKTP